MVRQNVLGLLRAGPNSLHRAWVADVAKQLDIGVSTFGECQFDQSVFKYVHAYNGSKMQGVKRFFEDNPQILERYDYIWLLEDDLFIPPDSARVIVQVARTNAFPLFQPTLSVDSHFSFSMLVQNSGFFLRVVDFVEQMAPVFRSDLLKRSLPHFDDNYSGFGYEWLWQKYLEENGEFAAVIDCAPIYHTRPIGEGDLEANAPSKGTRSDDLRLFLEKHSLTQRTLIYAGLPLSADGKRLDSPDVLTGTALIEAQVAGFRPLLELDYARYIKLTTGVIPCVAWAPYLLADVGEKLAAARAVATRFRSSYFEMYRL